MSTETDDIPAFPKVTAIVRENGTGELIIAGNSHPLNPADGTTGGGTKTLTDRAIKLAAEQAGLLGRPLRVHTEDPDGTGELIIHPDGTVHPVSFVPRTRHRPARMHPPATPAGGPERAPYGTATDAAPTGDAARPPGAGTTGHPVTAGPRAVEPPQTDTPAGRGGPAGTGGRDHQPPREPESEATTGADSAPPAPPDPSEPPTDSSTPPTEPLRGVLEGTSFLANRPAARPATRGLRGMLTRLGISMAPSTAELAEREDIEAVSRHWPGPRTIAVVNRKGGANKTPTVAALSAVFARHGGGGVLAWDNNENQGTLGWRTRTGTTRRQRAVPAQRQGPVPRSHGPPGAHGARCAPPVRGQVRCAALGKITRETTKSRRTRWTPCTSRPPSTTG